MRVHDTHVNKAAEMQVVYDTMVALSFDGKIRTVCVIPNLG